MEETGGQRVKLLEDIARDARAEAERIRAEAVREAGERTLQCERQIEALLAEARWTAGAQAAALEKSLRAAFAVEMRRITLRSRDRIFKRILERVEEKLEARVTGPGYRDLLLGLIVEAVIALGAPAVEVNASPPELALIDGALLKRAEERVSSLVLRPVEIRRSGHTPLLLQGVVVTAADGRTAFNNQIRTRIARQQAAIRSLIYERLPLSPGADGVRSI